MSNESITKVIKAIIISVFVGLLLYCAFWFTTGVVDVSNWEKKERAGLAILTLINIGINFMVQFAED